MLCNWSGFCLVSSVSSLLHQWQRWRTAIEQISQNYGRADGWIICAHVVLIELVSRMNCNWNISTNGSVHARPNFNRHGRHQSKIIPNWVLCVLSFQTKFVHSTRTDSNASGEFSDDTSFQCWVETNKICTYLIWSPVANSYFMMCWMNFILWANYVAIDPTIWQKRGNIADVKALYQLSSYSFDVHQVCSLKLIMFFCSQLTDSSCLFN